MVIYALLVDECILRLGTVNQHPNDPNTMHSSKTTVIWGYGTAIYGHIRHIHEHIHE